MYSALGIEPPTDLQQAPIDTARLAALPLELMNEAANSLVNGKHPDLERLITVGYPDMESLRHIRTALGTAESMMHGGHPVGLVDDGTPIGPQIKAVMSQIATPSRPNIPGATPADYGKQEDSSSLAAGMGDFAYSDLSPMATPRPFSTPSLLESVFADNNVASKTDIFSQNMTTPSHGLEKILNIAEDNSLSQGMNLSLSSNTLEQVRGLGFNLSNFLSAPQEAEHIAMPAGLPAMGHSYGFARAA